MLAIRAGAVIAFLALMACEVRSQEIDEAAPTPVPAVAVPVAAAAPTTTASLPRAAAQAKPTVTLSAVIDLSSQRMSVSVNGRQAHVWAISSGRSGYSTPRGTFRPQWKARMWYSRKYDMAPMPHSVFFKDGVAVHATSAVGLLGRPASHGCVRLAPAHAAAFYNLVAKHGLASTRITVRGVAPATLIARRSEPRRSAQASGHTRLKVAAYNQADYRGASHYAYTPAGTPQRYVVRAWR